MKQTFKIIIVIFGLLGSLNIVHKAFAAKIILKNDQVITGEILEETAKDITIKNFERGEVLVDKSFIRDVHRDEDDKRETIVKKEADEWQRKVSIGYSQAGGNTETSEFSGDIHISRKSNLDELTFRLNSYITTTDEEEDARKFYGMLRYATSFGQDLKWYQFFKFEGDQDRFANIDNRLIPSAGVGYWFSDQEDFKAMAETAIGYERTQFLDGSPDAEQLILVPRGFLETTLIDELKFREDITAYPSLEDSGEYRLHSETVLTNPINEHMSWSVSFIDDYNSDPVGTTKKNDYRITSSVDYNF